MSRLAAFVATASMVTLPAFAAEQPGPANNDTTSSANARIAALEQAVSDLMREKGENWLTEQRSNEIRAVVQDVLNDADTRASLQTSNATSGYKDGFFIASPDGNFKLVINGENQLRWSYNWLSSRSMANSINTIVPPESGGELTGSFNNVGVAKAVYGFELRRVKLGFSGHVVDPGWQYSITLAYQQYFGSNLNPVGAANGSNSTSGSLADGGGVTGGDNFGSGFSLENGFIQRDLGSGFAVKFGQFKSPLLREWLVTSRNQLSIERSIMNTLFTTGWTQGIELDWSNDSLRAMVSYNDGANNANIGSISGTNVLGVTGDNLGVGFAQWAFTGRGEWKPFGSWRQFNDFSSMRGEEQGLLLGAAANWQRGGQQNVAETTTDVTPGSGNAEGIFLTWTVDATWELGGASVFGAWAMNTAYDLPLDNASINTYGAIVQGGYFVSDNVEVFARWEWMNTAGTPENSPKSVQTPSGDNINYLGAYNSFVNNIGTVGFNWYLGGRNLKLSADFGVSWKPLIFQTGLFGENIAGAEYRQEGIGGGGQLVGRTQLQLIF
jgi:hypothetical protein